MNEGSMHIPFPELDTMPYPHSTVLARVFWVEARARAIARLKNFMDFLNFMEIR